MPESPDEELRNRTIRDFGVQWQAFDDIDHGYYGREELADILHPFLAESDLTGARIGEIGAGTGRITRMLLLAGAARVEAFEPSDAFDVLVRELRNFDNCHCHKLRGDQIPPDLGVDLLLSIGVVHHIPDPQEVLVAARKALRPGGRILIWIYGREGNRLYLAVAEPVRKLTRILPSGLLSLLAWWTTPLLWLYTRLAFVLPLPMRAYMKEVLSKLTFRQLHANIFDQLHPAYAKYYTQNEARALLSESGFVDVELHHRHGYSWTVTGKRPGVST